MTTILLVVLGVLALIAIVTYFASDRAKPKDKAKEAAGMAAGSALMGLGCVIQMRLPKSFRKKIGRTVFVLPAVRRSLPKRCENHHHRSTNNPSRNH